MEDNEKIILIDKKQLNIGIPINNGFFNNMYCSGINLNTLVWYELFLKCGYNVYFLLCGEGDILGDELINIKKYNIIKYTEKSCETVYKQHFDILFHISFSHDFLIYKLKLKNPKMKIYCIVLGNELLNFVDNIVHTTSTNLTPSRYKINNEIWISPHFKFSKFFYEIYCKERVYVGPYIWGDNLIKNYELLDLKFDKLNIAILEPNLTSYKNCIIPISICENAEEYLNTVNVFSVTDALKQYKPFINFFNQTELFKKGKICVSPRLKIIDILKKYSNCVVSFSENWDLNYVFLECFYFGIPLVHNSKTLKDYGYYYPEYDVHKGAEQLKYILKYHDREKYILKHKKLLEYYSINNKSIQSWVINRLNNENNHDFI